MMHSCQACEDFAQVCVFVCVPSQPAGELIQTKNYVV